MGMREVEEPNGSPKVKPVYLGRMTGNCYIVEAGAGIVLVDTGKASKRVRLEAELSGAGCRPGNLNLIILTHGDFDHSGNCSYLREMYGAKIAMHSGDSGMVERGDMFWNRTTGNILLRKLVNSLFRIRRFKPDILVEDGFDLSSYGLDAKVLHLPGHSKGSIGILTAGGELFCGDLFVNVKKPEINSLIDNRADADDSVRRLKELDINTVYPGHGTPFTMSDISE